MSILARWLPIGCVLAPLCLACSSSSDGSHESAAGSPPDATGGDTQDLSGGGTATAGGTAGTAPLGLGGSAPTTGGTSPGEGGSPPGEGGRPPAVGGNPPAQGGSDPGVGGSAPEVGGASSSGPSLGCGQPTPAEPPTSLTVDGTPRTFLVDIPAGYSPDVPTPILFAFHGMGTSGEMLRSNYYGNLLSAFGDGYIVVHPDALGDPTAWDNGDADVPFFDAMLEALGGVYCVALDRVFATGHSSGGFFTNTLGCQRGDVLRGIAPVSGGGPFAFGGNQCVGQLAVWLAHGSNDETVEITSGEDSRDHWGEANTCDMTQSTPVSGDASCVDYADCDTGFPVRWCVHEEGHDWPAFIPQAMYDFFNGL